MSNVKGMDKVLADLLAKSKAFEDEVKEIVGYHVSEIELEAIRNAPDASSRIDVQGGSITQDSISKKRRGNASISQAIDKKIEPSGLKGSVFVEESAGDIAAYVEFGTGQSAASYLATVDPEWREKARKFFVNGKGTIIAKPFLYPAYQKHRVEFINELKDLIKRFK